MPRLTIVNLTTGPLPVQDPSGVSGFSATVPASGTLLVNVSLDALEHLEDTLNALQTAGRITWTTRGVAGEVLAGKALFVGATGDDGYYYYENGQAMWFECDGVNPPTMPAFRLLDQVTGVMRIVTLENGVLTVST